MVSYLHSRIWSKKWNEAQQKRKTEGYNDEKIGKKKQKQTCSSNTFWQKRQTTTEVKHCMHTKTCLLYPHSHQRRQDWHPCHWQKNIPQWSEWTSGFWSSGCRTSDGNGLCSSGTLQSAVSSLVRMPRKEKFSPELTGCSTHVQKASCNLCHYCAILSALIFPPPFTILRYQCFIL